MALITFCHFKMPVYAFNASKGVTLNTEILCSFTEVIQEKWLMQQHLNVRQITKENEVQTTVFSS